MVAIFNLDADTRAPDRWFDPARHRVDKLERSIAEMRMAAAIEADWGQLHVRSREIAKRFAREIDASRQIATARQIRGELHQASDSLGLRALRLAAAGPMTGWLSQDATNAEAQALGRLFAADQRLGILGLTDLEKELEQAQTLVRTDERTGNEIEATSRGSGQGI